MARRARRIFLSAFPSLAALRFLLATRFISMRGAINWSGVAKSVGAAAVVPLIEETFFRGLVLGALLKNWAPLDVDLRDLRRFTPSSISESAGTYVVDRNLDVGIQFNRARVLSNSPIQFWLPRLYHFVSDRVDFG